MSKVEQIGWLPDRSGIRQFPLPSRDMLYPPGLAPLGEIVVHSDYQSLFPPDAKIKARNDREPIKDKGSNVMKPPTEGAAMNPSTPKTELPLSTQLRNLVSGGSLKQLLGRIFCPKIVWLLIDRTS